MKDKLTKAEAQRLKDFIASKDGQINAGALLGARPETLSRTLNRRTAPSPLLRGKLVEHKIIKA